MSNTQTPIHIVHIIPTLALGGAEQVLVALVNHSDRACFRHTIIVLSDEMPRKTQVADDVDIVVVPKRGKLSLYLFGDIARALRKLSPDIVQTHLSGGDIWGRVAARRLGVPIVSTQMNMTRDLSRTKNIVMRWLRGYADMYVACSEAVRKSVIGAHGVDPSRICVIHNMSIELGTFTKLKLPVWHDPIRLVSIGRLEKQKGYDLLFGALDRIIDMPWTLTIVGQGSQEKSLRSLAQKLGLGDRITFAGTTNDVSTALADSDISLVPSRYEGFGIVAIEAMAAGRPVIASAVDGLCEFIADGDTGFLVPAGDTDAWAKQISWCMLHKKESIAVGKRARAYAKKHFVLSRMVSEYEAVYRDLLTD